MSKGIGQNTRDHKTLDTMGRADMQMTLETLFLSHQARSVTWLCWHLSNDTETEWMLRHKGDLPKHSWVTQRRDSTTSPLSSLATQTSVTFAHDSFCAKENVTRLNRHFRITIATVRIDTIDKCEMREKWRVSLTFWRERVFSLFLNGIYKRF